MRLKKVAVDVLKGYQPLYIGASKLFHLMNPDFKPGNPGAPQAIYEALKKAKELNNGEIGDYYEFGLWRGYTLWSAQKACQQLGLDQVRLWGFDSFQGLPEVEGIDKANREFYKGQFNCSKEKMIQFLDQNGMDWSRTKLIEGFYGEVLTEELRKKYSFRKAAVAYLDCDLYSSTRDVFQWLEPYLADGSFLLLDDWFVYGDNLELGQPKALDEFIKSNPRFQAENLGRFGINGNSFLLHERK